MHDVIQMTDAIRSKYSRMHAGNTSMSPGLDAWAPMVANAASFWVAYWGHLASFHVRLLSASCSPSSKTQNSPW